MDTAAPTVDLCTRALAIMSDGGPDDFARYVHPRAVNREAKDEPPACREPGPAGMYATALWLRSAFSGLTWTVHDVVAGSDLVVMHTTMSGTQVGPFVTYDERARVRGAMPARGRDFAVTQTHWFRVADGQVIEHWANRDDLGMAEQLGWVPPSPAFLVRMVLAKRRARRLAA